jgi:predicted TIM-barrel fold metal-dependent hydrolase
LPQWGREFLRPTLSHAFALRRQEATATKDASHEIRGASIMQVHRREFHQRVVGWSAAAVAGSLLPGRTAIAADQKFPPGRYVDVHTHLGQTWNKNAPLTAEELLRWMDAGDIAQAVVLPLVNPEASSYPLTTDFVLAETKPHRDRLIPFCSIDPRTSYVGGHRGLVDMLKRYIDAGVKGFGEHKPGVPMDDPRNIAIFKGCAEAGLPVLFHLDSQRNTDRPGLPGLEKVLQTVPDCVLIGHGPGFWASISGGITEAELGGYPKGPVAPGGALDRLMEKYPNLYGDLSAGSGASAISRDEDFGRAFLKRRADRLMFGTDFLAPGQNVPQLELYRRLELPAEVQAKVFRDNARKLLKLG